MKLWNKFFLLALVVALAFSLGAILACDDDDDDDTEGDDDDDLFDDDDDNDVADDDVADDDVADDDVADDDVTDDDVGDDDAPVLSNGLWDPTDTVLVDFGTPPIPGFDDTEWWASALVWAVCDVDNDLLPDGVVYILDAGTSNSFISSDYVEWSDLNDPPDADLGAASDCENPIETGINILFAPVSDPTAAPPGTYCVDIEGTDSAGNFSNKLLNICVNHDPS